MKTICRYFHVAAVIFAFSFSIQAAEPIPPATAPVYLLSGRRPINPGQENYKLLPWDQALESANVPATVVASLKKIEGLPFSGEARFRLGVEATIGPDDFKTYFSTIKRFAAHPHPNPQLPPTTFYVVPNTQPSGEVKPSKASKIYTMTTGGSNFTEPSIDAFTKPPGTNQLPNVYTNLFDSNGREMHNTLPSTKLNPYNLHDGEPVVTDIDQTSPTDDLRDIYYAVIEKAKLALKPPAGEQAIDAQIRHDSILELLQRGVDILEGNPVPDRAYSGLPVLHYHGPLKVKHVTPFFGSRGKCIGGNVDVHQIWYDSHIESDTALLNAADVWDVPWTMTYTIDMLSRGHDDFSPFGIFTDDPAVNNSGSPLIPPKPAQGVAPKNWKPQPAGLPHYGMDQSFFPMEDGTRTVVKIKMPPGKYFHLIYTWGWRMHPPRIQSADRATKAIPDPDNNGNPKTLVAWETDVFGENPMRNRKTQLAAIYQIGDLAPAKQMWHNFNDAVAAAEKHDYQSLVDSDGPRAFFDWRNRGIMRLPRLTKEAQKLLGRSRLVDPETDITLLYANNTIYGELRDGGVVDFPSWTLRAKPGQKRPTLKVTIYNGDNFRHAYVNVDFGGSRGWENQFKSSVQTGGSGCWFTFGRANWWVNNAGFFVDQSGNPITVIDPKTKMKVPKKAGPITLPPADPDPKNYLQSVFANVQRVNIIYNYEPSRRLRFYQFDPTHHDVCILSIH